MSEQQKYFGLFGDRDSVIVNFFPDDYNYRTGKHIPATLPVMFPTDEFILFAAYEYEDYSGYAIVVYTNLDGDLFEVNGSHCSCYGLEGQWNPEATSREALAMRKPDTSFSAEAQQRWVELFGSR